MPARPGHGAVSRAGRWCGLGATSNLGMTLAAGTRDGGFQGAGLAGTPVAWGWAQMVAAGQLPAANLGATAARCEHVSTVDHISRMAWDLNDNNDNIEVIN